MSNSAKTPAHNPCGLAIGDVVLVRAKTEVDYVTIGDEAEISWEPQPPSKTKYEKQLIKTTFDQPKLVTITGVVKKATGTFHPSRRYYDYSLDGDDYTPARLTVDKYHWLYEVREDIKSKPFWVHPDDFASADLKQLTWERL